MSREVGFGPTKASAKRAEYLARRLAAQKSDQYYLAYREGDEAAPSSSRETLPRPGGPDLDRPPDYVVGETVTVSRMSPMTVGTSPTKVVWESVDGNKVQAGLVGAPERLSFLQDGYGILVLSIEDCPARGNGLEVQVRAGGKLVDRGEAKWLTALGRTVFETGTVRRLAEFEVELSSAVPVEVSGVELAIHLTEPVLGEFQREYPCAWSAGTDRSPGTNNTATQAGVQLDGAHVLWAWRDGGDIKVTRGSSELSWEPDTTVVVGSWQHADAPKVALGHVGGRTWLTLSVREVGKSAWSRLYYSDDGGASWSQGPTLDSIAGYDLFLGIMHSGRVWGTPQGNLLCTGTSLFPLGDDDGGATGGIYRSTDGGSSWSAVAELKQGVLGGIYTRSVPDSFTIDPDGAIVGYYNGYYAGGEIFYVLSLDDGVSWQITPLSERNMGWACNIIAKACSGYVAVTNGYGIGDEPAGNAMVVRAGDDAISASNGPIIQHLPGGFLEQGRSFQVDGRWVFIVGSLTYVQLREEPT